LPARPGPRRRAKAAGTLESLQSYSRGALPGRNTSSFTVMRSRARAPGPVSWP